MVSSHDSLREPVTVLPSTSCHAKLPSVDARIATSASAPIESAPRLGRPIAAAGRVVTRATRSIGSRGRPREAPRASSFETTATRSCIEPRALLRCASLLIVSGQKPAAIAGPACPNEKLFAP